MMAGSDRSFFIANGRALKRHGLAGFEIEARLEGQSLTFSDEAGRKIAVSAAQVDRLRLFRMQAVQTADGPGTPTIHETKIWWDGGRVPILLIPVENHEAYRAAMGTFARQVAAARGLDRIRLGPGYLTAIINLLLVGPICLALLAYVFYIAVEEGGWWWAGAMAILLVFGWLAGSNIVSRWPRRLKSLDRLDAELK
jgi:hypothetical protein